MINTPSTPGNSAEQTARNEHILAVTTNRKPGLASYNDLANIMSQQGQAFKNWTVANQEYNNARPLTATIGAKDREVALADKLRVAHIARIEYLAPMDMASAKGRGLGVPPLLSDEDWDDLACAKGFKVEDKDKQLKPVSSLLGEERAEAVKKFKEENYGKYADLISEDQLSRAGTEVQKSRQTLKGMLGYVGSLVGFREKSEAEKQMAKPTESQIMNEIKADIKKQLDSDNDYLKRLKEAKKDPNFNETDFANEEIEKKFKDVSSSERRKKSEEIEKRNLEIIQEDLLHGKASYQTNVTDISADMEISLQALVIARQDVGEFKKTAQSADAKGAIDITYSVEDIKALTKSATEQLQQSILHNYHHFARKYEERFAGAGKMSRYGCDVDAHRSRVSDGQEKVLKGLDENKEKFDKEGKLLEGKSLTVNGIPCENVGVVDLYKLDTGFSFMGRAWGGGQRIDHIGKFLEAWMEETTAGNQTSYQAATGEPLTVAKMLEAYASGDKLPNSDQPNKNKGPNGPINALRISTFPVGGGVQATLRAFAEMQAFAHILGIEINIDTQMIAQNSQDSTMAHRVRIEWLRHNKLNDPTYGKPALDAVEAKYGLQGIADPAVKREKLIIALRGHEMRAQKASHIMSAADQPTQVGMDISSRDKTQTPDMKASGTGAPPPTPPSSPAHPSKAELNVTTPQNR